MGKLRSMFGQAIREAHALGYSREEIERIVEEQLTDSPFLGRMKRTVSRNNIEEVDRKCP